MVHYFDTPEGQTRLFDHIDRPCRYARTLRCTPSSVFVSDDWYASEHGLVRLGTFSVGDVDKLFRDERLAQDTIVVVPPLGFTRFRMPRELMHVTKGTDGRNATMYDFDEHGVDCRDVGQALAAINAFDRDVTRAIAGDCDDWHDRHRIMCLETSDDARFGRRYDVDRRERDIASLKAAGACVVRMEDVIREDGNQDGLGFVRMDFGSMGPDAWMAIDDALLDAIKTLAASTLEMVYRLFTTCSTLTNVTLQLRDGAFGELWGNSGLWQALIDGLVRTDGIAADDNTLAHSVDGHRLSVSVFANDTLRIMSPSDVMPHVRRAMRDNWSMGIAMSKEMRDWYNVYVHSRDAANAVIGTKPRDIMPGGKAYDRYLQVKRLCDDVYAMTTDKTNVISSEVGKGE